VLLPLLQYPISGGTFFENILENIKNVRRWHLDSGSHNPVEAQEVSMAARVSAAKSETRRSEGEEREEVSKRDAGSIEFDAWRSRQYDGRSSSWVDSREELTVV
jgi:hypothetical protein